MACSEDTCVGGARKYLADLMALCFSLWPCVSLCQAIALGKNWVLLYRYKEKKNTKIMQNNKYIGAPLKGKHIKRNFLLVVREN